LAWILNGTRDEVIERKWSYYAEILGGKGSRGKTKKEKCVEVEALKVNKVLSCGYFL